MRFTKTPRSETPARTGESASKIASEDAGFNADRIQEALGHKGQVKGGVLQISIARPEHITMEGATLPPSMGMATALNFQDAGQGKLAATRDLVLTRDEVGRATKALAEEGSAVN